MVNNIILEHLFLNLIPGVQEGIWGLECQESPIPWRQFDKPGLRKMKYHLFSLNHVAFSPYLHSLPCQNPLLGPNSLTSFRPVMNIYVL